MNKVRYDKQEYEAFHEEWGRSPASLHPPDLVADAHLLLMSDAELERLRAKIDAELARRKQGG